VPATLLPDAAVVRVSRGSFDRARFAEVQAMTVATGRYLIPAISELPGLISYYAAASPDGRWSTSASGSPASMPGR